MSIESILEKLMNDLDKKFLNSNMTEKEYEAEVKNIEKRAKDIRLVLARNEDFAERLDPSNGFY